MKRQATAPTGTAQSFAINETFFSLTDPKGIIIAGNDVFARTSGYLIDELLGAPHNIIRHPDMPRCVFSMLWENCSNNKPFAGYVKNHAQNGNHYWVFAIIEPLEQEILSIRIKPSCQTLETVEALYSRLIDLEEEHIAAGHSPREATAVSQAELQREISQLGFDSYTSISQHFLNLEIKSRDKISTDTAQRLYPQRLRPDSDPILQETFESTLSSYQVLGNTFSNLDKFLSTSTDMRKGRLALIDSAEHFRHYALNTNIASAPLGDLGATIGTITEFLHNQAQSFSRNALQIDKTTIDTAHIVSEIVSRLASARVQLEMLLTFMEERTHKESSENQEQLSKMTVSLQTAIRRTLASAIKSAEQLCLYLPELKRKKEELLKTIVSFNAAQTSGMIECARIPQAQSLADMFLEFGHRIQQAKEEIDGAYSITDRLQKLCQTTPKLIEQAQGLLTAPATA